MNSAAALGSGDLRSTKAMPGGVSLRYPELPLLVPLELRVPVVMHMLAGWLGGGAVWSLECAL